MVNLDTCHADFVFSQGLTDKDILLAEITWAFRMTSLRHLITVVPASL